MVFGMRSKARATKAATKPPKKFAAATNGGPSNTAAAAAAANNNASRKKGLKKTRAVGASSSATLGTKSTTSSKLKTKTIPRKRSNGSVDTPRSGTYSKESSTSTRTGRSSIASTTSTVQGEEEREGTDTGTREAHTGNQRDAPVEEALEQELAAASEDNAEANDDTHIAARNVAEEDTAPYGGLDDKYASESVAVENPPLDTHELEQSEEDDDEEAYDEESSDEDKAIDNGYNKSWWFGYSTHEDAAPTEPDTIAPDASAAWQAGDEKHHRSPRSSRTRSSTRSLGSNEREQHLQERQEKKRPSKSRNKAPRDRHRRSGSPPSSRPTSRSRGRNRPRRNDADRVNEYLKNRDANSYDEHDRPKSHFKQKVEEGVEEVQGTTQDILLSVFQVCCAFALRGKEINGFVREIDNARNELR